MSDLEKLQQFEGRKVRSVWVETEEHERILKDALATVSLRLRRL